MTFPWLTAVTQLTNSFNLHCSHQTFCHPACVRRQTRAARRLMEAVRTMYGERRDRVEDMFTTTMEGEEDCRKQKRPRKSESASTSPEHRRGGTTGQEEVTDPDLELEDNKMTETNPAFLKYLQLKVKGLFHAPLSVINKSSCIISDSLLESVLETCWRLLLHPSTDTRGCCAAVLVVASVKTPQRTVAILHRDLTDPAPHVRINACLKIEILWRFRYQIWPRLEENGQINMKVVPSQIEFTLPSPKIGIENLPVVDPPWMPKLKTKVENLDIRRRGHTIISATQSRKKQQTELVRSVLYAEKDKKRKERENLRITSLPVEILSAQEPSLASVVLEPDQDDDSDTECERVVRPVSTIPPAAQALLPSTICSSFAEIVKLLEDHSVNADGVSVYQVAYQVIWTFLTEDSNLFLKFFMEKLTRENQEDMFQIIRNLIRFIPQLPHQAAFSLYNYLIGYIMFYVRTPRDQGEILIGSALSLLWMVVHSVQGIGLKDLKQILRKEQVGEAAGAAVPAPGCFYINFYLAMQI